MQKKAGRKLSALTTLSNYWTQFRHCPLTWVFHGRMANSKINHIRERALRIV